MATDERVKAAAMAEVVAIERRVARRRISARGSGHRSVWNGAVTRRREFKPNAISLKTDSHECEFGTQNPTGLLYNTLFGVCAIAAHVRVRNVRLFFKKRV